MDNQELSVAFHNYTHNVLTVKNLNQMKGNQYYDSGFTHSYHIFRWI